MHRAGFHTKEVHCSKCFGGSEIGVPDRLRSGDLLHERQACCLDYTTGTEMERVNGIAPLSRPWHGRILLLNQMSKTKPQRFQRKRGIKSWRMPPNSKYAGRPTPWGNPFKIGAKMSWDESIISISSAENGATQPRFHVAQDFFGAGRPKNTFVEPRFGMRF